MKRLTKAYIIFLVGLPLLIETHDHELEAFQEQTQPKPTSPQDQRVVDRSQLSVNELLKEIEYFNEYMSHLYKKQQQKAALQETRQKEQHLTEMQQLELITQKMNLLLRNSAQETFVIHESTLKTLQITLGKISESYDAGILSITTFEKVSTLLQSVIILLETHIAEASQNLKSIEQIKKIASAIKDYQICKEVTSQFHVTFENDLEGFIRSFPQELDVNSQMMQKVITHELSNLQLLKQKQSIILQQLKDIKINAIKRDMKHLKNITVEPFSCIQECLEAIAHNNKEASTYQDQLQLIKKLKDHTISIAELNRAIQYISKQLQTKNSYDNTTLYTMFENQNIEEVQSNFQDSVEMITRNYNGIQKVLLTISGTSEYQQLEQQLQMTHEKMLEKEMILAELQNLIDELKAYLEGVM